MSFHHELLRLSTNSEGVDVVLSDDGRKGPVEIAVDIPENGTAIAGLLNQRQLMKLHAALGVAIRERQGKDPDSYYSAEVRDDHDGGSVWIIADDYMDEDDATALAAKLSRTRDNRAARVKLAVTEVVAEYQSGDVVGPG